MKNVDRWAIATVLSTLPLRLALACATDLSPDEAYYLACARTGWLPPDHPPLTVALARLGDALTLFPLELRLRLFPLALGVLTAWTVVRIVALHDGSPRVQRLAAMLMSWTLLPMAGGFLATPDAPAVFACASLLLLERRQPSRSSRGAAFVVALLGLTSKVVLLPWVLALAFLPWRRNPLRLPMLAALACAAPFLAPSLLFQLHHAFVPHGWSVGAALGAVIALVAGQLALWTPAPWWNGLRSLRSAPLPDQVWLSSMLLLVVASAFIRGIPPEPNWLAPVAVGFIAVSATASVPSRPVLVGLVALGPVVTLVAASHVLRPWLPLPATADPAARLHGWNRDTERVVGAGMGEYSESAERCVYRADCAEITEYLRSVGAKPSSILLGIGSEPSNR